MSSDACLLAFLVSDLALALGSRASMALPRLMAPVPVIFALSASKPPGMSRFFATCAAATHWPRFLKPPQAVAASWPVSGLILPATAGLWPRTSLGEGGAMTGCEGAAAVSGELPTPEPVSGPRPAGGPHPRGAGRGAKPRGVLKART